MRDYNSQITYKSLNNFVDYAVENEYAMDVIEGVLNDTYVIYNVDKELSIKGVKARGFIILYPKFQTSWNNSFHILMTNDESKVIQFTETDLN
jgi:hypothetical protein